MHKSREYKPHVPILALTIILYSSTCLCVFGEGWGVF